MRCVLLVTSTPSAGALGIARAHGVPAKVVRPSALPDESAFARTLLDLFAQHNAEVVALAGYLKKIPASVVAAFPRRIVNIHPALLPRHGGKGLYGRRVHAAVLAAGDHESGATVHFVDEGYDTGPIIQQARVPVLPHDTAATLAARVLKAEHKLYPRVLRLLAENRVNVQGRTVTVS